jgi:hypothetical protein
MADLPGENSDVNQLSFATIQGIAHHNGRGLTNILQILTGVLALDITFMKKIPVIPRMSNSI